MENEKCFCHLNGYKVKDAEARNLINDINISIEELQNVDTTTNGKITTLENTIKTQGSSIEENKDKLNSVENDIVSINDNYNNLTNTLTNTLATINSGIGNKDLLSTSDKSNLVNAINEVFTLANSGSGSGEVTDFKLFNEFSGTTFNISSYVDGKHTAKDSGFYINTGGNTCTVSIASSSNTTYTKKFYIPPTGVFFWNAKQEQAILLNYKTAVSGGSFGKTIMVISVSGSSSTSYELSHGSLEETISGLKTYTTLPQSSLVPSTDNQLVNKKYVDDKIEPIFAEMHTDGNQTFDVDAWNEITTWSTSSDYKLESGGLVCDTSKNGIKVPAGTCEYIEVSASITGQGGVHARLFIEDVAGASTEHEIPFIYSQSDVYSTYPMAQHLYKIDSTKDLWIKIKLAPKGTNTFILNNGFDAQSSFLYVKGVK